MSNKYIEDKQTYGRFESRKPAEQKLGEEDKNGYVTCAICGKRFNQRNSDDVITHNMYHNKLWSAKVRYNTYMSLKEAKINFDKVMEVFDKINAGMVDSSEYTIGELEKMGETLIIAAYSRHIINCLDLNISQVKYNFYVKDWVECNIRLFPECLREWALKFVGSTISRITDVNEILMQAMEDESEPSDEEMEPVLSPEEALELAMLRLHSSHGTVGEDLGEKEVLREKEVQKASETVASVAGTSKQHKKVVSISESIKNIREKIVAKKVVFGGIEVALDGTFDDDTLI